MFQPRSEPEPFNDSTAALNLQRRSSIPLLPAKFIAGGGGGSKKNGKIKSPPPPILDENDNKITTPATFTNKKTSPVPETVSVTMDNSTKITENLNVQKKTGQKSHPFSKLHELSRTLQQTVRDQQIIRRSSSSFIGINTASVNSLSTNSDSESESFHTSENTPSSVRSAPSAMLLLSPISSSSGQFSPSTFSPTSPASPTLSTTSFSSNGTLSPCETPSHSYHVNNIKERLQQQQQQHQQHHHPQDFIANSSAQACLNSAKQPIAFCSKKPSAVVNGFPVTASSSCKVVLTKNVQSSNYSSKYHLHNLIITEGDLGPPPTTIDYQTGELILKRYGSPLLW